MHTRGRAGVRTSLQYVNGSVHSWSEGQGTSAEAVVSAAAASKKTHSTPRLSLIYGRNVHA